MATPIQMKRRVSGNAGAPSALKSGEFAYNMVDDTIYAGKGDDGGGDATSIVPIGGTGSFIDKGTAQTITGAKTFSTVPKSSADASGATDLVRKSQHDLKAPLNSPSLTGAPTAPTPAASDNTTRIATTAFVQGEIASFGAGDMAKSIYDGDDDGKVDAADFADGAPWAGITGKPSTFTPTAHNHAATEITSGVFANGRISEASVTQHEGALSITESQISDLGAYLTGISGEAIGSLSDVTITSIASGELLAWNGSVFINRTLAEAGIAETGHGHSISDTTGLQSALDAKAPLASPALTGNPTAPTQTAGDNSTKIATTAYADTAVANAIDAAPAALDTLNELAAALGDDPNFSATISTSLGEKLVKASNLSDLASASAARTNLGLGSMATQAANAVAITGGTIDGVTMDGGTF